MIFLNKNQAGKLYVITFGVACILDGIIIILSLGFLSGKFCLTISRYQAKIIINKFKK